MIDLSNLPPAYARRAAGIIDAVNSGADLQQFGVTRMRKHPRHLLEARLGRNWRMIFAMRGERWEPAWVGSHEDFNKLNMSRFLEGEKRGKNSGYRG